MAQETVDLGSNINFEIDIHPVVIVQILDLYYRKFGASRQEETIVGGALLGTVYTNKVHITECFALVVDQGDETNPYVFDFSDAKDLYLSHLQANPQEVLLGGFITTEDLSLDISVAYLSTEFSKKENGFNSTAVLSQPIILKVNPTLKNNKIDMKAFKLNQSLKHYAAVASFNTMPIKISFSDENLQQAWPFLAQNLQQKDFKIVNTVSPQQLVSETIKNIEKLLQYLDKVIAGNEVGDQELGRRLLSSLNQIDLIRRDSDVILGQVEEAQLFQYISNFTQGQALINEKLQKI